MFSSGAAHHTGLPSAGTGSDSCAHSTHAVRRPHLDQRQCNMATNMLECVLPVCPHEQRPGRMAHSPEHQRSCGHEPLHVGGIAVRRIVTDSRPGAAGVGREIEEAPEEGLRQSSEEDLLLMGKV